MELVNKEKFFSIIEGFELVPYTQFKGMYDFLALSGPERIHFYVNDINMPTMACFGSEKTFLNKKMILIEGECYATKNDYNVENIRTFYESIKTLGYDFVEINSLSEYNFNYEIAMRQAGFLKPVGQFTMPLSKIVDLCCDIKYNQNWKRNIKKATNHNLKFEVINTPTINDSENFTAIHREMNSRKSISTCVSTNQIYTLCTSTNFQLYFVTNLEERIAGIVIHKIKNHAGLLYAASTQLALSSSATFFMYEELFKHLYINGYTSFDLETLVPSTDSTNNVFLFKNGIGGRFMQLNGEWSWYKKSYYRPLMYFVKKHLMKKREL